MATAVQLRARLEPLKDRETVYGLFLDVVKSFEAYLIDLNQIRLEEGQDIFGDEIGRYSRTTELAAKFSQIKPIQPKKLGEPYNFQWTGGLFDGMYIDIFPDRAQFTSRDSKTPELIAKYGDMFGLQPQDLEESLREKLYPGFMKLIRNQLGL